MKRRENVSLHSKSLSFFVFFFLAKSPLNSSIFYEKEKLRFTGRSERIALRKIVLFVEAGLSQFNMF